MKKKKNRYRFPSFEVAALPSLLEEARQDLDFTQEEESVLWYQQGYWNEINICNLEPDEDDQLEDLDDCWEKERALEWKAAWEKDFYDRMFNEDSKIHSSVEYGTLNKLANGQSLSYIPAEPLFALCVKAVSLFWGLPSPGDWQRRDLHFLLLRLKEDISTEAWEALTSLENAGNSTALDRRFRVRNLRRRLSALLNSSLEDASVDALFQGCTDIAMQLWRFAKEWSCYSQRIHEERGHLISLLQGTLPPEIMDALAARHQAEQPTPRPAVEAEMADAA